MEELIKLLNLHALYVNNVLVTSGHLTSSPSLRAFPLKGTGTYATTAPT